VPSLALVTELRQSVVHPQTTDAVGLHATTGSALQEDALSNTRNIQHRSQVHKHRVLHYWKAFVTN